MFVFIFYPHLWKMIPAPEFVDHIEKAIVMIEKAAGKNLYERRMNEAIAMSGQSIILLMTVNF